MTSRAVGGTVTPAMSIEAVSLPYTPRTDMKPEEVYSPPQDEVIVPETVDVDEGSMFVPLVLRRHLSVQFASSAHGNAGKTMLLTLLTYAGFPGAGAP